MYKCLNEKSTYIAPYGSWFSFLIYFSVFKASPRIRFNKEGSLLAVSANDNKIKILASVDGLRLMRTYETHSHIAPRPAPSDAPVKVIN